MADSIDLSARIVAVPGTDEVILVASSKYNHSQVTYRFRYDPEAPPPDDVEGVPPDTFARKTDRTCEWYDDLPPADRDAVPAWRAGRARTRWPGFHAGGGIPLP